MGAPLLPSSVPDNRPDGVSAVSRLGSGEKLKSGVEVDVSSTVELDGVGEAFGVGFSREVDVVMYEVESSVCSGWVTNGSPSGLTKVMAASVRVNTLWSMGSTMTAVSTFTS